MLSKWCKKMIEIQTDRYLDYNRRVRLAGAPMAPIPEWIVYHTVLAPEDGPRMIMAIRARVARGEAKIDYQRGRYGLEMVAYAR
jgi:hypothetical protein